MFNGKFISIGSILSNIMRYPFVEGIQKEDVAVYLSNFLRLVGAPITFNNLVKEIEIKNYRADIPSDMIYIKGIRYSDTKKDDKDEYTPMRYASDLYHSGRHCTENIAEQAACRDTDFTYILDEQYIKTSTKEGFIQIAYQAIQTDNEGLPMVPDDTKITEALKYYILWQYAEPAYYRKDVPKDIYNDIKTQYMWYVGAATNMLNMPSPDQMKTLENGIIRLIKSSTQHENVWRNFQRKERLDTDDKTQRLF